MGANASAALTEPFRSRADYTTTNDLLTAYYAYGGDRNETGRLALNSIRFDRLSDVRLCEIYLQHLDTGRWYEGLRMKVAEALRNKRELDITFDDASHVATRRRRIIATACLLATNATVLRTRYVRPFDDDYPTKTLPRNIRTLVLEFRGGYPSMFVAIRDAGLSDRPYEVFERAVSKWYEHPAEQRPVLRLRGGCSVIGREVDWFEDEVNPLLDEDADMNYSADVVMECSGLPTRVVTYLSFRKARDVGNVMWRAFTDRQNGPDVPWTIEDVRATR